LLRTRSSMLKLKCFSSDGVKTTSIGSDESGPTTPCVGSMETTDSPPPGPVAKEAFSKANEKGRCSVLTRWSVSRAPCPMSSGPKLCRVRSSVTPGSRIVPTSRKGTSILSSGTWKRQCDSCSATDSGVKWKTISYLRPASTVPLRVWQRKGCATSSVCGCAADSSVAGTQKNSYVFDVGLIT